MSINRLREQLCYINRQYFGNRAEIFLIKTRFCKVEGLNIIGGKIKPYRRKNYYTCDEYTEVIALDKQLRQIAPDDMTYMSEQLYHITLESLHATCAFHCIQSRKSP